jgi:DNA-binding Lrp family transcriptional regulator
MYSSAQRVLLFSLSLRSDARAALLEIISNQIIFNQEYRKINHMSKIKIDTIDITILRRLQQNARTKYSDIAKECNKSVDTIIKRFQKLKQKGIITNTTLLLDPHKFGDNIIANFSIDIEPQSIKKVLEYLNQQEGILFNTHVMGKYNVFSIATRPNMNEINKLKEKIQSHNKVRDVRTSIWVDKFLLCPQNFELELLLETNQ